MTPSTPPPKNDAPQGDTYERTRSGARIFVKETPVPIVDTRNGGHEDANTTPTPTAAPLPLTPFVVENTIDEPSPLQPASRTHHGIQAVNAVNDEQGQMSTERAMSGMIPLAEIRELQVSTLFSGATTPAVTRRLQGMHGRPCLLLSPVPLEPERRVGQRVHDGGRRLELIPHRR